MIRFLYKKRNAKMVQLYAVLKFSLSAAGNHGVNSTMKLFLHVAFMLQRCIDRFLSFKDVLISSEEEKTDKA
jgi:hypothetical protein